MLLRRIGDRLLVPVDPVRGVDCLRRPVLNAGAGQVRSVAWMCRDVPRDCDIASFADGPKTL